MVSSGFDRNLAVVIGINDYGNGISPLQSARADAEAIADILETQYQYQVIRLTDTTEVKPTLENIKQLLEQKLPTLLSSAEATRLLFYFAGHGIALNGEEGPEGYLIPQDAQLGNVQTYLPMTEVHTALLQLSCRHFLGILDCCFAGAFRWSSTRKLIPVELGTIHKERFDRFIHDPAWQVITSASYDQTALDAFTLKDDRGQAGIHSPFAAALIEALQGKADAYPPAEPPQQAGDGIVTATELYLYLRDRVEVPTEARAIRQTPSIYPLKKHDKGEYVFLVPGRDPNLPPAPLLDRSNNPYRGLEPFEEQHHDVFFGRKALTQELHKFVASHAFTVVIGASGSGKSSLVKSGLLPKLRNSEDKRSWTILSPFRPGESPLRALSAALASVDLLAIGPSGDSTSETTLAQCLVAWFRDHPTTNLLFIVDQFEELITLCRNEQERQLFLEALKDAIATYPDHVHLLITLRSDFEPQLRNTVLEPYWIEARFIVPAMTREELREAIEEPASARVMYFNPHKLVDQLIDEVANMPGALPLLSFALSELYLKYLNRQEAAKLTGETIDRAMTQEDYEDLGGVTRSLTQRAEQEFVDLVQKDPAYEYTIRNVMLRMVSVNGELARRRVPLSELEYPEPENGRIQTVIKRFEIARLLTPGTDSEGHPYQEPAHDVLVRGWKRLLDWKQQHLGTLVLQRELTSDANQWKTSNKRKQDAGLLWIEDPRLPTALQLVSGKAYKDNWFNLFRWRFGYQAWQAQIQDYWLNAWETDFVWQSFNQKFRRFAQTTIAIAGVIVGLSVVTGFALRQAKIAQLREQSATVLNLLPTPNAVEGMVLAIDTMAQSLTEPQVAIAAQNSLLTAVQVSQEINQLQDIVDPVAFSLNGQYFVSGNSHNILQLRDTQTGKPMGQPIQGGEGITSVAVSPDGKCLVTGNNDNTLQLWSTQTGHLMGQPMQGDGTPVRSMNFSTDGQLIVSGHENGSIQLWNANTYQRIGEPMQVHRYAVWSVAFSPDGQRFVSGSTDHTLLVWDTNTRQPVSQPMRHESEVTSVAFSLDGQRIISSSLDNTAQVWDANTYQSIGQPLQHENDVSSAAFSPDGQRIVTGNYDNSVRLWDVKTSKLIGQPLQGHVGEVWLVAFSPDGQHIISHGNDNTVRIWDTQISQPIGQLLPGYIDLINLVAFSSDSQRIIGIGSFPDFTVWLWDTQTGQLLGQPLRHTLNHQLDESVTSVAVSLDGQRIVTGHANHGVQLWDAKTGQSVERLLEGHQGSVNLVALSPDGQHIFSSGRDNTIRLWDIKTGQSISLPLQKEATKEAVSVAFSSDGQRIVTGHFDGTVQLWNAETLQSTGQLLGHKAPVRAVAFSPDGERIVSGSQDKTIRRWDVETGQPIGQPLQGHRSSVVSVALSPDSQRIVSGSSDGTIRLWNATTGQPIGQPLQIDGAQVFSVAFSPDNQHIASGSNNGAVQLWDASPEGWLKIACNRLQYHPLLEQPETIAASEFRQVAYRAEAACQRRVWNQQSTTNSGIQLSWFDQIFPPIIARPIYRMQESLR